MNFDLRSHTIFLSVTGSRAYGTARPDSDWDLRGIAVAPLSHCTGFLYRFEQAEGPQVAAAFRAELRAVGVRLGGQDLPDAQDASVYDLRKFCQLACDANPNILELLFLPERFWIVDALPMQELRNARRLFLSKKVRHTFAGYAHAQLKRIRTHRRWLLSPPKGKPTRADHGLPDESVIPPDQWRAALAMIDRKGQEWEFHPEEAIPETVLHRARERTRDMLTSVIATLGRADDPDHALLIAAGTRLGMDSNFLTLLDAEKRYRAALAEWNQYKMWERERNPARAELEAAHSYDTKHGSHLVRLYRMGAEMLATGECLVERPDADELRAIRNGAWTYERLEQFAEENDRLMDRLYADPACPLPREPDRAAADRLCAAIVEGFHPDGAAAGA